MPLIAHNGFRPAFRYSIAHLRAGNSATERIKRQTACAQVSPISLRSGFANQPALRFRNQPALKFRKPKSWPTCFTLRIIAEILTVRYNCQLEP